MHLVFFCDISEYALHVNVKLKFLLCSHNSKMIQTDIKEEETQACVKYVGMNPQNIYHKLHNKNNQSINDITRESAYPHK